MAKDKVDPSIVANGFKKPSRPANKIADVLAIIFAAALIAAVVNTLVPIGQVLFGPLVVALIALYLWKPMPPK